MQDFIMFGKVISAGLVVAGYVFLGVWLSQWLTENGFSLLISISSAILVTLFGMWQAWLFLTKKTGKPQK